MVTLVAWALLSFSPKWTPLFDGKTFTGWKQVAGTATYRIENGTIVGKTATGSPNSFLATEKTFRNFELEFEVKVDDRLNSGVQLRSFLSPSGTYGGPQVEIESSPGQAGYVYGEGSDFGWMSPEPNDPSEKVNQHTIFKNREWNRYRVIASGARIQTFLNGKKLADVTHEKMFSTHSTGSIGLQVHSIGSNEGPFEVAWKNIRIKELP